MNVPSFAVVGRVNAGKTATLATLLEVDDNDLLRVSSTPGETTRVQELPVVYQGETLVRFLDTPGFQQPVEAMRAIQSFAGSETPGPDHVRLFVAECGERFPDEVRLLEPILNGAGVLYVVDPSNPLRDAFVAEMEILRWTGQPRLALLNPQGEVPPDQEAAWRERLGATFNLVRSFDAHSARYEERRRLLESLLQIDERHGDAIRRLLEKMDHEWTERREQVAEAIVDFLEKSLLLRVHEPLDERDEGLPSRLERKKAEMSDRYFRKLAAIEQNCVSALLKLYRHHLLKADNDPSLHEGLDLATDETWRKWGLNRTQLSAAGALAGGAAGAVFDLGVGIHSLGAGTVIGAIGGGIAAFFKGGSLPELKVKLGGIKLAGGDGKNLVVGPPGSPNFPWVLLDSMLLRYQGILHRAHGRRDAASLKPLASESLVRTLPSDQRATLQKWFTSCLKGTPDRGKEPEVFALLLGMLA
jgi:GTPase Era involved in 16S rRNA processing